MSSLDLSPVFHLLIYIYGFMAFCSLFGILHPKLRRPEGKPVRQAINSWWPPALLGGLAVTGGLWTGMAVFVGISVWTFHEYLRMMPADARNPVVEALAYAAIPMHYGLLATNTLPFAAGLAAWTFGVLPIAWIFTSGSKGVVATLPRIQWGLVLTAAALSHAPRLFLTDPDAAPAGGAGFLALLLLLIMANDAAQYVFGKIFGRHSLAPALSPKKTWEGFAGGLFTTTIIAAAASPLVTPLNSIEGMVAGAALSSAGLLGDLLVSGIKRDVGVKDTGAVLPQHGGVLDRCDSLLMSAPLYFYGIRLWLH